MRKKNTIINQIFRKDMLSLFRSCHFMTRTLPRSRGIALV